MPDRYAPPAVAFRGRLRSSREMESTATAQWEALGGPFRTSSQLTAVVMANHPEAIALFFAVSACPAPLVLLPPDVRAWETAPALPPGTRLVLPPSLAHLEGPATARGMRVRLLPEVDPVPAGRALPFLTCPGLVFFTSGSTGLPRPVYRTTQSLIEASSTLTSQLQFPDAAGVIAAVPLDRAYGMNNGLMAATVLGRSLGLIDRFDHTQFLALCATGSYWYWAGTPVMADVLSRSQPTSATVPAMCAFAGRLPAPLVRAFASRFSTPLRQLYGTTETLTIAYDRVPAAEVRVESAGQPLPGVCVSIGEAPHRPQAAGEAGRIWVKSPWLMEGYGFPPDLERAEVVEGWWATPDVGRLEADGRLTLLGRLDDRIRTATGHVVDPGEVAAALESLPGVTESAVVPIDTAAGPAIGALVEVVLPIRTIDLREHAARRLPGWALPRAVAPVSRLPRLASGRVDRRACIEMLAGLRQRNPS